MRVRIALIASSLFALSSCELGAMPADGPSRSDAAPPATASSAPASTAPSATTTTSPSPTRTAPPRTSTTTPPSADTTIAPPNTTLPEGVIESPGWLGERPLPRDEDGDPASAPTPPELVDRRLATVERLAPPPDEAFRSSVGEVPPEVAARSTWTEDCPVTLEELSYVTVTFRGFDQRAHTGELLVAESVADDLVAAFRMLYEADYPIEEMAITSPADLDAEPTGDGNPTTAFVCRPVTGGNSWSEHAYGLAIDVNPFHNPYVRGETVLPELAGAYVDRDRDAPGMIHEGDAVTEAFDAIGWQWGGRWSSLKDYQHFSLRGR